MKKVYFLICLILLTTASHAATYYVRQGSPGGCTTSNPVACTWANAYPTLPASLERGSTYFIADGSYAEYTFSAPASGTTFIYLKKATVSNHGTSTGWLNEYGDGQAIFRPWNNVVNGAGCYAAGGYIDIDGYSEHVPGNYGFKLTSSWHEWGVTFFSCSGNTPYMQYHYIDFAGPAGAGDTDFGAMPWTYSIFAHGNDGSYDSSHMLVSHCAFHGVTTPIQDNSGNGYMVVEYCDFYDSRSVILDGRTDDGTNFDHGNIYWIGSSNGTFRYNRIHNYNVEGLYFGLSASNWKIYGNVFYDGAGSVARGIELTWDRSFSNILIYQNTFVNFALPGVRVMPASLTSGVDIKNNLFFKSSLSIENGGAGVTTANNLLAASDPFVNLASDDYHLKAHTSPGTNLGSPYNIDADGNVRATWDLGAYEFGGVPPAVGMPHPADTNSDYLMALNEATKYGACWKNPAAYADCPAGIPINYAVRAGTLWAASANGQYQYNSSAACPLCWVVKP